MPGTNSFYPYGESSTNILNNSEYQTDSERSSGAQSGAIARSRMYNKQARQAAAGAYAVGALVAKSGKNADDSSAATLAANFQAAVNYQAAHFVASAVSVSGTTATATVAELATTAAADLPALFALSLVLDQALPAGASIAIASSLPDVTLSWPIYVGSEVLDSDTITGGAITLLIDTVGAKAFFKAGGGSKIPNDLPPLNPNFTLERSEDGTKIIAKADKLLASPETAMLAGGVWVLKSSLPHAPDDGTVKEWSRADLITTGKPYDGLYLGDVTASDAANETILWLPENQSGSVVLVPFIVLSVDYLGGVYVMRKYLSESMKATWGSSFYYPGNPVDTFLSNTYLNSILDKNIASKLIMASVPVQSRANSTVIENMERKAWVLSYGELYQTSFGDGIKMPYFEAGASHRIAYVDGGSNKGIYWTRSRESGGTPYSVDVNGAMSEASGGGASNYIRPAFVLPKDFKVQQRPDGSYTVWNDMGLLTLGDIEASSNNTETLIGIGETSGLKQMRYLSKGYNENNDVGLLEYTTNIGTTAYGPKNSEYPFDQSTLLSFMTNYLNTNLRDALKSIISQVNVPLTRTDWSVQNVALSYFSLSLAELGTTAANAAVEGEIIPWYGDGGAHRAARSGFSRTVNHGVTAGELAGGCYAINSSGDVISNPPEYSWPAWPVFCLPLTAPIRALADGTYDLVPEDPALSAQVTTYAAGDTVSLSDIPVSAANSPSTVKITEEDGAEHEYLVLVNNYQDSGGILLQRYNATSLYSASSNDYASESDQRRIATENWAETNLPQTVRDCMIPVTIPYRSSSGSISNYEANEAFLLSGTEVGGSVNPATGSAIPYFNSNAVRIKRTDANSAVYWWTRDFAGGSNNYVVTDSGSVNTASGQQYIVPAFVLSPDTQFINNGDGSYTLVGMPDDSPTVEWEVAWDADTPAYVRQYTYNYKGQYQTMLQGAVASTEDEPIPTFELPEFTGNHAIFGDEISGRIELYESGSLTLYPGTYDLFLVGGGGNGGTGGSGGGGGGYTTTSLGVVIDKIAEATVLVGASDSQTAITIDGNDYKAEAGASGAYAGGAGGSGGGGAGGSVSGSRANDGGAGGSNGGNGSSGGSGGAGGAGQGTITRAFGEESGTLYGGGGGGAGSYYSSSACGAGGLGGEGGGGRGGGENDTYHNYQAAAAGTANTGGGGGGSFNLAGYTGGGAGGSGIIIIRWNNA